jgi:acyl-CoA dehydrogenase
MDFTLPDEVKEYQTVARKFVEDELIPRERKWSEMVAEVPVGELKEVRAKAKTLKLGKLGVPKEYGGLGLGAVGQCAVVFEMSRSTLGRTDYLIYGQPFGPHPALYEGTEYQKKEYLIPTIEQEKYFYFAYTEPGHGSDFAGIETTAVKDGDNYIINGTKYLIGGLNDAAYGICYAVTDKTKGVHGISAFLVDTNAPGFRIERGVETMGMGIRYQLAYENCVVPARNLLGPEGEGFFVGMKQLNRNRIIIGAYALGPAIRCLEMSIAYAKKRVTFGKTLGEHQAIQWMLADSFIDIQTTKWMTYHAAWKFDQGQDIRSESAAVKAYVADTSVRIIDRAMQVFGGIGYTKDLPIENLYRQARSHRIAEGTAEMMRRVIARQLLQKGLPQ